MTEPFHAGEVALQEATDERDKAILNGRLISNAVPAAARAFVGQQAYVAFGWVDAHGDVWSSLVVGEPGFASTNENGTNIAIDLLRMRPESVATIREVQEQDAVGLLFMEMTSRRRLRVNGPVGALNEVEMRVDVTEAYPNCPKYIQRRELVSIHGEPDNESCSAGFGAPVDLARWLATTDTVFVASFCEGVGVDCSHRGGRKGFIRLLGDELFIPDYAGNSMFGTLGNLSVNPRAGLTLIDFARRRQLQLSGYATVHLSSSLDLALTGGTGRWWSLKPASWRESPLPANVSWQFVDESPFNP